MKDESNSRNTELPIKKTTGETLKERLSENAYERILPARYLRKNPEGETVESQEELFERVAKNIALADALYEAQRLDKTIKITPKNIKDNHSKRDKLVEKVFGERLQPEKAEEKELETNLTENNVKHLSYDNLLPDLPEEVAEHVKNVKQNYQEQMEHLKLMPNSPALMNAGDELQQMSACFVISPDDDMEDIHDKSKQASKIFQCLTENHYVYEKEKGLVQVKDINKGDEVIQGSTFEKVKDTFSYEDSPVIEVELSNGITIEGTPNHKILVDDSWKKLENIDEGETIDLEVNWIPERSRTIKLEKVEKGGNWNRKYSNQEILKEYNKGKSDYEIAETLGAGSSTIQRRRVQELELPPNGQGGRSKQMERSVVNKIEKLHKKGLTNGEIAEKIEGLSKNSVNRIIKNIGKTSNGNPVKEVSQPDILSEELSELVGLWVGDGSIHQDGIRFHIKRDKTKDRICEIVKNQFDTKADYIKDEENYEIIIHSHEIKRWFLKNFGEGKKEGSTNAQVPEKILKSDRKNIESFLKGLFTADGSNSAGKKVYPQLTTSSEKLAEQVQTLLFGLGIPAERKEFHRDNDYESARFIRAKSEKGRKRFYNNIGFIYENNKEKVEKINNMNTNLNEEECLKTEITSINDKEKQKDVYDIKIRNKPVYTVNSITSHNSGGGCGYGFWKLRPKGDKVGSSGGVSSGPLSFMRTYDQVCSTVAQGGCVSSDTRIMTTQGYKKISDLHRDEKRLIERKQSNELIETPDGMHSYMETSSSGSMSVYEINTESGYDISGSKDHLVLCIEEGKLSFKQLQEVSEGDKVVLSQENRIPNTDEVPLETLDEEDKHFNSQSVDLPEKMTENISFFLGYLWADGSFNPEENRFVFCVANTEKEQRLKERLISTIEDWDIDYKLCDSNQGKGDYEEIRFVSSQLSNWMVKNGFNKDLDKIPEKLYQKPEFFKDFLAGMSADSSYSKDAKIIEYSTISKSLANNIQDMLMCMGIPTKTHVIKERKDAFGDNPVYVVRTLPGRSSEKYDEKVPHPYRDHNLGEGGQRQNQIKFADNLVSKELEKEFTRNNKLPNDIDKTAMKELRRYERGERTPSRKRLKEMFEKVNIENIEELNEQYYYDTVTQKGKKQNVQVYDIEVIHDNEYYIGNNFVTHNKRRGAQMGVMRVTHPDIIEFIHSKRKAVSLAHTLKLNDPDDFTHNSFREALEEARELINEEGKVPEHLRNAMEGHLSNFNISVGITDDFMEAVYNDEEFTFTNPRTGEDFIANEETVEMYDMFGLGEYVEEGEVLSVPAKEIWDHIIEGAHENGEPGVVFLERMNKEIAFDPEEHPEKRVYATNPCLTGDMKVAIANGKKDEKIKKLAKKDSKVPVYTHNEETGEIEIKEAKAFKTKENVKTVKIETDGEVELELTEDHKVATNNRGWVKAKNLDEGDSLHIMSSWNTSKLGGEDCFYRMATNSDNFIKSEHRLIAKHLLNKDLKDKVVHHKDYDSLNNNPENLEVMSKEEHQEEHDISGEDNPLYKLKEKGEFEDYMKRSSFYNTEGENNPMYGKDRKVRVEFECPVCNGKIEVTPSDKETRRYCSVECKGKAMREKDEFECVVCGKEVEDIPSIAKKRRYCSRQCASKEFEQRLSEEGRESLIQKMKEDNPMSKKDVVRKSTQNTDYEEVAEKTSKTRKEKIENGELVKKEVDTDDVECRECGNEYSTITNTHLDSKHNMTVEEYKEKYPNAPIGNNGVKFVKKNHKVTSIKEVEETKDVYDMKVPETHNFYAGRNVLESEGSDKRVYVKLHNCGEQELFDYDACNLKHINLSTILDNDCSVQDYREFSEGREGDGVEEVVGEYLDQVVDWSDLDERVHWGTRFLDNVVTMSDFPVDKIEDVTRENRKIGLGVMGYAQMLVQMGVEYGSEEANEIARQLMNYINDESVRVSQDLAVNDGKPGMGRGVFEDWDKSKWSDPVEYKTWFEEEYTDGVAEEWEDGFPVRNHSHTTVAPTGCVLEGSTVSTPEGLVRIDDFVDEDSKGKWNSINEDVCSDDGVVSATNGFENGESDIRRITTEKGFEVSSTEDHKFRVINEDGEYVWKRADEIDVSDSLVLRKDTTSVEDSNVELDTSEKDNFHHNTDDSLVLPEKLTPELSEFLGFYVGDGYVHDEKSVNIAVDSEKDELFNYIMDLSKEVFGVTPTVEDKGHVKMICVGGRHITRYFEDNGWRKERGNNGEGSANARVPSQVMRGGSSNMKSFIKGFVEADGTAPRKVEMVSSSENLLKDIQDMLLSIGIVFKREKKQISEEGMSERFGDRDMYVLRGLNKNEDKKFVDRVGLVDKSLDLDVDVNSYEGDDYPGELIDELRDMDGYYDVNDSLRSCLDNARYYGHISRGTLKRFFENDKVDVDEDSLVYKLYSDFFVDEVSGVEKGTGYTLDLEVPENRTYIANGFVSHNTTSMIGNTSGGCEPIYSVANFKNVTADIQGEDMLVQFDDFFLRVLEANDVDVEAVKEEAKSQMNSNEFDGVDGLETVPDELGELFVTTSDLSAIEHASVQCAFQEGVSSSISKTVNAPNEATVDDTREAFEYVYDNGGKGVTYYRDGTRAKQVLTTRRDNQEFADEGDLLEAVRDMVVDEEGEEFVEDLVSMLIELEDEEEFVLEELAGGLGSEVREIADGENIGVSDSNLGLSEYRKRPDNLVGATVRVNTGYGTLYVTLNEDENGELFEVFAEIGKSGGLKSSFTEGISRMVSMSLRYGVPPERIMKHLSGIKSAKTNWDNGDTVHSVPDGIALALERYLNAGGVIGLLKEQRDGLDDDVDEEENEGDSVSRDLDIDEEECPECSNTDLDYGEGCLKCHECGWSKC